MRASGTQDFSYVHMHITMYPLSCISPLVRDHHLQDYKDLGQSQVVSQSDL